MDSESEQLLIYFTIAILLLGCFLIVFVIIYRLRMNNYLKFMTTLARYSLLQS